MTSIASIATGACNGVDAADRQEAPIGRTPHT